LTAELQAMTRRGLDLVSDPAERAELRPVVDSIAEQSFERWLSSRTTDDNRVEHEFVVFGAAMRIAEAERLPLAGKLVVICATFLHDTSPIQRITERAIREAEVRDRDLAVKLREPGFLEGTPYEVKTPVPAPQPPGPAAAPNAPGDVSAGPATIQWSRVRLL